MADINGPGRPEGPFQQISFQDLDLDRLNKMVGWGLWLLALIPLFLGIGWALGFYADYLWFDSLGHTPVLTTVVGARVALFVAAVVLFLAIAIPNLIFAFRATSGPPLLGHPVLSGRDYQFVRRLLVRVTLGFAVLASLLLAAAPAVEWETVLLFLNRVPFGETDPIFGHDIGFFVFTVPALELLRF